jgi:hypothetical protein
MRQESSSTGLPHKRGWLWFVLICSVVLATAALLAFWFIQNLSNEDRRVRSEIQRRLAALRAAGEPMTAEDLAKRYPDPPENQDASRLLEGALRITRAVNHDRDAEFFLGDARLLARTNPLPDEMIDAMRQWLNQYHTALSSISWDKLNGAWIGSGFANGFDDLTKTPGGMVELAKILCLDSILRSEQGDRKEAVQSLQRALTVADTLKNDLPIHCFIRVASQSAACRALERIVNRTTLSDADLQELQSKLKSMDLSAVREFMANERGYALYTANSLGAKASQATGGVHSPVLLALRTYESRILYHDGDLLDFLEWDEEVTKALNMPALKAIPYLKAMERERNKPERLHVSFLDAFRRRRFSLLNMFEPNVGQFLGVVEGFARVKVAIAAMAIERWRLAHDSRLPESLAELVPDYLPTLPTDSYDDQTLRYKKLARGYVIYSIGPDFTDDGGKEKPTDAKESDHYDITFTVER